MKIRFDTLDKKPKVYGILLLTVLAAAAILTLRYSMNARLDQISFLYIVYYATVVWMLGKAFFRQLRYNPYSYNSILYSGFTLFFFSVLLSYTALFVYQLRYPDYYTVDQSLHILLGSAHNYIILSMPFLLGFSAALCVSNLSLIRHEGRRPVNMLGILLSLVLMAGAAFLFFGNYYATGSQTEVMIHDLIFNVLSALYLYFECMLIGTIISALIAARYEPDKDKDVMIILGCGIRKDGTPSPILAGRIDRALRFYEQQLAQTGKDMIFVTSGGQGPDEVISESASMKAYLLQKGVPADHVIEEDRSADTAENMRFSKEKIEAWLAQSGRTLNDVKVAYSTTNYHVFRGGLKARRVKLQAQGVGAKTRWYFWPNAFVREFVGLLSEHRGKQALVLGGMVALYAALTLYNYLGG